jgi:RNA polymerase sigma-70 factor (ECF subfamily)
MTFPESPPDTESDKTGDSHEAWLSGVFERFQKPLVSYAARLLNGRLEPARDCVQETFLALCKQPRSSVEGHVEAWLFRTCRHRIIDHQRRRNPMNSTAGGLELDRVKTPSPDPSEAASLREEHGRVEAAVKQLPAREQELLAMRLVHQLSYKQIAEITGLSVSNVGFILHQAVTHLREAVPG